ncbi:single-stranded DNA-binding protein [candidate division KSB1 bacterium]|nr:single-stranded DNA-binding protein [candidate division KSB1 bacterium]
MASAKGTLNKVMLIGRLGADPELQYTPGGTAVARISLATNRAWKDESGNAVERTDWHRVIAWRKQAEFAGEWLKKGSQVYIEGRLETRSWTDKNQEKRYITEVIVETFTMLGRRDDASGTTTKASQPPLPDESESIPGADEPDFSGASEGDDLPF